jgi:hypothetical protein
VESVERSGYGEYAAIAAVSAAVLLFEVLVTRILSVTLSYHFAFLTVSLAMLGLAAPGVWFSMTAPRPAALRVSLYLSAVALPVSVLAIVHLGAARLQDVAFWIVIMLLPLLALGSAICLLLLRARAGRVSRIYAADLAGAAAGALLAVPLLHGLPTPAVVAALGLLPLLAAWLVERRVPATSIVYAAALAASVIWGEPYRLHYTRFSIETRPPVYERWTATARITIFDQRLQDFLGWGIGLRYRNTGVVPHLWLDQDGSAGTPILQYRRGDPYPAHLAYDVVSAAYQLTQARTACIIGGGGGRDILKALQGGATSVDVVELNPYTVDAVSRVFADYSGDPYHLPGVHAVVGEGRNYFSRSRASCDVMEVSQIDTFAASAAGAYALTENSLYTVESIQMLFSRLSDHGVLSISRWASGPAWPEAVRLVLLEMEALKQLGVGDPRGHLAVLASGGTANVLLFRQPLDAATIAAVGAVATERGYVPLWPMLPGRTPDVPLTRALTHGPGELTALGYDMSPPTDNRPFFFQTLDFVRGSTRVALLGTGEREQSVVLLRQLVLVLSGLTLVLVFAPMAAKGSLPRGPHLGRHTLFFASLGFGFMFVEIPLLQRLAIYLGHPSYATTVVLGSLLTGAGTGAWLAGRVTPRRQPLVMAAVPLLVGVAGFGLLWAARHTIAEPFAVRATLAAVTLAVAGAVMGLALPMGMANFDDADRSWFWAVNGATSVLASVLAIVVALVAGFTTVLWCSVVAYGVAALTLPRRRI